MNTQMMNNAPVTAPWQLQAVPDARWAAQAFSFASLDTPVQAAFDRPWNTQGLRRTSRQRGRHG